MQVRTPGSAAGRIQLPSTEPEVRGPTADPRPAVATPAAPAKTERSSSARRASTQHGGLGNAMVQARMDTLLPSAAPVLPASVAALTSPVLSRGATGEDVVDLQRKLTEQGFSPGAADGDFGPATESAVKRFQSARGLESDGVVGPLTWAALDRPVTTVPRDPQAPASGVNAKLAQDYAQPEFYGRVEAGVKDFYPANKSNGCVAYMSEALRQSGVNIPIRTDDSGENISLVTKPFSEHLQNQLGWNKITDAKDLKPGDVVLTQDEPGWPGYPAHTYMFQEWVDQGRGIANVIDNQGHTHERNIFEDRHHEFNFTPFAYALRAPA